MTRRTSSSSRRDRIAVRPSQSTSWTAGRRTRNTGNSRHATPGPAPVWSPHRPDHCDSWSTPATEPASERAALAAAAASSTSWRCSSCCHYLVNMHTTKTTSSSMPCVVKSKQQQQSKFAPLLTNDIARVYSPVYGNINIYGKRARLHRPDESMTGRRALRAQQSGSFASCESLRLQLNHPNVMINASS